MAVVGVVVDVVVVLFVVGVVVAGVVDAVAGAVGVLDAVFVGVKAGVVVAFKVGMMNVAVEVAAVTCVVGRMISGVEVAADIDASVVVVSGVVGVTTRWLLSQFATAVTPSAQFAYVCVDVPVLPMLPGLKVEAPMPSRPKSESFCMIAIMSGISTPYCCAAANTIAPVTGLPGAVD